MWTRFEWFRATLAPFALSVEGYGWGSFRGQRGPKPGKNLIFSKAVQDPLGGSNKLLWAIFEACFDPCGALFGHFGPFEPSFPRVLGPRWSPTWAPNRSKLTSFKGGPGPFGRVKPIVPLTNYMAIPGTGYRIPLHRAKGKWRGGGSHHIPVPEMGKIPDKTS